MMVGIAAAHSAKKIRTSLDGLNRGTFLFCRVDSNGAQALGQRHIGFAVSVCIQATDVAGTLSYLVVVVGLAVGSDE
jgi:hypothetical protein